MLPNKKLDRVENLIASLVIGKLNQSVQGVFRPNRENPDGRKKVKAVPRRVLTRTAQSRPMWIPVNRSPVSLLRQSSEGRRSGRANVDLQIGTTFSRHHDKTRGPSRSKIQIGFAKREAWRWRRKSALFRVVALRGDATVTSEAAAREQRPKERKDVGAEGPEGKTPKRRRGTLTCARARASTCVSLNLNLRFAG